MHTKVKRVVRVFLPDGSKQRIMAGQVKNILLYGTKSSVLQYRNWIKNREVYSLSPIVASQDMTISVVVPCFNTPKKYLQPLIKSMLKQTYTNWELRLADGSTDAVLSQAIKAAAAVDKRIVYIKNKGNLGIAGNTNAGIKGATGTYVAFLDHDDILPHWSLNEVAVAIARNPKADILYSDEDRLTDNGKKRMSPLFKPDWSLDFFLSANYITHLFVIKKRLLTKLAGLRSEYDGSQDYDLALRALDYNPQIIHIPKILYHMRMASSSTAKSISIKEYVGGTGSQALTDYFKRHNIAAEVRVIPDRPSNYRIHYEMPHAPLVSIIIPFKDKPDLLKTSVGSILKKTSYKNYEIILVSNNSKEPATFAYLKVLEKYKNIKQYIYDKPFNYSAVNNFGRSKARGKVLVFLNNDTKVLNAEWLEELAATALQPEIGAVGALLTYPDGTIQHAGIVIGLTGMAGHVFRGLKLGTLTPLWLPDWPRNYLAITGACLAVEASIFDAVDGFNETFIVCGSDVTLCLDIFRKGYRNVYWPYARLTHYESKSVGSYSDIPPSDYDNSLITYQPYLQTGDPYFNPNLDLMIEIPSMRREYVKKLPS
jgi:glycosyltransferase involved in cell wall biosynthesis